MEIFGGPLFSLQLLRGHKHEGGLGSPLLKHMLLNTADSGRVSPEDSGP